MTSAQLKNYLNFAILIGRWAAPRTETKIDDQGVELLEKLAANDALLALVLSLFKGDADPATANLTADESATWTDLLANPAAMDTVRAAMLMVKDQE